MTRSIGIPRPDCTDRADAAATRRADLEPLAQGRGSGVTTANGEEVDYGLGFAANYHKGLPHAMDGTVHCPSYHELVRMLSGHEHGAIETLPVGANRTQGGGTTETDPQQFTESPGGPHRYRKLTSPFTGHVFDTQGADSGALAISPAPRLDTDELAAEMAELYAMALLRDVPFTTIAEGTEQKVAQVVNALQTMPWFNGSYLPTTRAETRRFGTRGQLNEASDLFRGSTPGSKQGPWVSQFLVGGHDNTHFNFAPDLGNSPDSEFLGTRAKISEEDGFILYGTQIIDQRAIVAKEGIDYMTNWPAWLDCQNGVDFNDQDIFRPRRRFLTTPRDIATYVHYDALYQAYLVACLRMLPGKDFPQDRGMPETSSRTRSAFASFGGPHILALLPEVSSRALKAVWRQKWLHHRRTRPEVVAALLTLQANDPDPIAEDDVLRNALQNLRDKIPPELLSMVQQHNTDQNASTQITAKAGLPADFPVIADDKNYLLPQAFPEGSPTHPAYGAGHATVAGACVTVLKAFFEMYEEDGQTERHWPAPAFVANFETGVNTGIGGQLVDAGIDPLKPLTVQGELDKLAMNISNARNMAGVHYYTDYFESIRLGERVATSILEEQLSMYGEPVSMSFTSFDGDRITVRSNGGPSEVLVEINGDRASSQAWYDRYGS